MLRLQGPPFTLRFVNESSTVMVTLQYFDGCPNWRQTLSVLHSIASADPGVEIQTERVDTPESAEERCFRGSPTVLINQNDPFADEGLPVGLTCRLYPTPTGIAGSPTADQLRQAIASARHHG